MTPKRAKNLLPVREILHAHITSLAEMADDVAETEAMTPAERERLRSARDRLKTIVDRLMSIFDAHDAMLAGEPWTKSSDTSGPALLSMALHEAFTIGKFVTQNPIMKRALTIKATQTKALTSKRTDDLLASERENFLSKHPRSTIKQTVDAINGPLNKKLKAAGLETLGPEALRKRIRYL